MDKQEKKFEELYKKFTKKCVQDGLLPTMTLEYRENGIFPVLKYFVLEEKQKEEFLSSLNKEK